MADELVVNARMAIRELLSSMDYFANGRAALEKALTALESGEIGPRSRRWRDIPHTERDQVILDALADSELTNAALEHEVRRRLDVNHVSLQGDLQRLMDSGDVSRRKVPYRRTQTCWGFTRTPMAGPIADLERVFGDS